MLINDYPKAYLDVTTPRPRDGMASANIRNNTLALASGDKLPLRPQVTVVLEYMDYPGVFETGYSPAAAADWSGTGVTVLNSMFEQNFGIACLKLAIDATGNRTCTHIDFDPIDLSDCALLGLWHRANASAKTCKFVIRDSSANESYWNLTTHATADTWAQLAIVLATPDGNNGTDADLTDIVAWEFQQLEASTIYLFDRLYAHIAQKKIYINPSVIGNYFAQTNPRIRFAGGVTGEFSVPTANRIDLVSIDENGNLTITEGDDKASPDYSDIPETPEDEIPICAVYCKSTMTKIVEYHFKDADTDEGYIYEDLRPYLSLGGGGSADADQAIATAYLLS